MIVLVNRTVVRFHETMHSLNAGKSDLPPPAYSEDPSRLQQCAADYHKTMVHTKQLGRLAAQRGSSVRHTRAHDQRERTTHITDAYGHTWTSRPTRFPTRPWVILEILGEAKIALLLLHSPAGKRLRWAGRRRGPVWDGRCHWRQRYFRPPPVYRRTRRSRFGRRRPRGRVVRRGGSRHDPTALLPPCFAVGSRFLLFFRGRGARGVDGAPLLPLRWGPAGALRWPGAPPWWRCLRHRLRYRGAVLGPSRNHDLCQSLPCWKS